ncbi:hypothetical protein [Spiroplasma clarkii]|uniref:Uncharacterized protein n=1 Tax=Spiroplasma clarkii TaxID=2139 RepID=A0A2K8KHC8_9MOLU|nr:hypothetical protein [Spiroplasma clarkii]ATX71080.1 hypothetical protein SCLAR_v1c07650 [Spiroplasma clarkii]
MIIKENREIKSESLESILDSLPPVCRPYAKREFANLKKEFDERLTNQYNEFIEKSDKQYNEFIEKSNNQYNEFIEKSDNQYKKFIQDLDNMQNTIDKLVLEFKELENNDSLSSKG